MALDEFLDRTDEASVCDRLLQRADLLREASVQVLKLHRAGTERVARVHCVEMNNQRLRAPSASARTGGHLRERQELHIVVRHQLLAGGADDLADLDESGQQQALIERHALRREFLDQALEARDRVGGAAHGLEAELLGDLAEEGEGAVGTERAGAKLVLQEDQAVLHVARRRHDRRPQLAQLLLLLHTMRVSDHASSVCLYLREYVCVCVLRPKDAPPRESSLACRGRRGRS